MEPSAETEPVTASADGGVKDVHTDAEAQKAPVASKKRPASVVADDPVPVVTPASDSKEEEEGEGTGGGGPPAAPVDASAKSDPPTAQPSMKRLRTDDKGPTAPPTAPPPQRPTVPSHTGRPSNGTSGGAGAGAGAGTGARHRPAPPPPSASRKAAAPPPTPAFLLQRYASPGSYKALSDTLNAWFAEYGSSPDVEIEVRLRHDDLDDMFDGVLKALTKASRSAPKVWKRKYTRTVNVSYPSRIRKEYPVDAPADVRYITKTRMAKPFDLNFMYKGQEFSVRFALCRELPSPPPHAGAHPEKFRVKMRTSFVYKDEFAYELTRVASSSDSVERALDFVPDAAGEVELEWCGQALVKPHRYTSQLLTQKLVAKAGDLVKLAHGSLAGAK